MRASVLHNTRSIPAHSPSALTTASRRMCAQAADTAATATFSPPSPPQSYTSTHTPLRPSPSELTSLYTVVGPFAFPTATPQSERMRAATLILSRITSSTSHLTATFDALELTPPGWGASSHSHAMRRILTTYWLVSLYTPHANALPSWSATMMGSPVRGGASRLPLATASTAPP